MRGSSSGEYRLKFGLDFTFTTSLNALAYRSKYRVIFTASFRIGHHSDC
jgi:hypothetical protein